MKVHDEVWCVLERTKVLYKRWVGLEGWRRRALADGHVICELVISPCCIKPVFSWMSAVKLQADFIPARL